MASQNLSPGQRFWRLLQPDRKEITNLYIYSIFNGLVYLTLPLGIQAIVNLIQVGQISTSWVVLVIIVIAGIALTGILQIYQLKITEMLQQKLFIRAAFEFTYRLPRLKEESLRGKYAPELMNRFFDTVSVQKGLSKILIDFSTASIQIVFGLIVLSFYHSFFTLFSLLTIAVIWVLFRMTFKRGLKSSLEESKYKYQTAHWLEEIARNKKSFSMAAVSDYAMQKTDEVTSSYIQCRETHFKTLLQQYGLLVLFKVMIATGLLAIGGILVLEQQMNIGQFVAAEIIILLIMSSVEKLVLSMETIYDVLTSLEKIGQITDLPLESTQGLSYVPDARSAGIELKMKNVNFSLSGIRTPLLQDFNLEVRSGSKIVIKSDDDLSRKAMAELILGNYTPTMGSISVNDIPVQNLELSSYRNQIGFFSRHDEIIAGTVLDNITMRRDGITVNDVVHLITQLGLQEKIEKLENGYQTLLTADDKMIHHQFHKKIILARNLIHKPKLILAGDIFHAFSEAEKQKLLTYLLHDDSCTVIFLTNDQHVLERVETCYTLANGNLKKTN